MKKIVLFPIILFSLLAVMGNLDGAFPENTGAPGELTCGRAPCHNVPANVGNAVLSIEYSGAAMEYFADSTYQLTVKITNPQTQRNGFQILALDANNQNIGDWQLTEPAKMKIIPGIGLPNRKYVTHQAAGNLQTEWSVDWKAPAANAGKVTFYASVNSANDNGMKTGDEVYTGSLSLEFAEPNAAGMEEQPGFRVYPTPAGGGFWVEMPMGTAQTTVTVFDMGGNQYCRKQLSEETRQFVETGSLAPGAYLLVFENDAMQRVERVVVF